jgi:hypothetical protein
MPTRMQAGSQRQIMDLTYASAVQAAYLFLVETAIEPLNPGIGS